MPSRTLRAGHVLRLIAATGLVAGTLAIGVSPVGAVTPGSPLTITADQPPTVAPKGHLWAFNDYFPRSLTVHKGQTIQVNFNSFHTATFLPRGMGAAADLRANGLLANDADDTTRNPGGQTHSQFRLAAIMPTNPGCGTPASPCSFTGTAVLSSGASLAPGPVPAFFVTINAPVGVYILHCRIHPGMSAAIRVAPASVPATSKATLKRVVKSQLAQDVKDAMLAEKQGSKVSKSTMSNGHTHWTVNAGASSPARHVALLEFLPGSLKVRPGDVVTWRSPSSNEPHTVTFPVDMHADLVPMCEDATTGTDTPAIPTVPQPTGPGDFGCGIPPTAGPSLEIEGAPGNGVRVLTDATTRSDSGLVASSVEKAAFGLPSSAALSSWTITVSASAPAGTYTFVCQIHDGMKGRLVVGP
jgi:plastocyanin